MSDPYVSTRKQSVGDAAIFILVGVIIALFEGWILGTAAREGFDAVFGRGRTFYVVPFASMLAAALFGVGILAYRSGRYLFSDEGQAPSATTGAIVAIVYALVVTFVFASKYYHMAWTESLGAILIALLVLCLIASFVFLFGRSLITGDWSQWK